MADPETVGPCGWPDDLSACCSELNVDPNFVVTAKQVAAEILWAATGRRFGECELKLRPCRRDCYDTGWSSTGWPFGAWPSPALINGSWINIGCGGCINGCSCTTTEEVILPGQVTAVTEVKIDGQILTSSAYRLDDGHLLVRQDGGRWPLCQNLSTPLGQPGTWSATLLVGQPLPKLGELAYAELACEIIKDFSGDECRLPGNMTSLVRQGVTQQFIDPRVVTETEFVGLKYCDQFIRAYNPGRLTAPSRTFSPDVPRGRRVN